MQTNSISVNKGIFSYSESGPLSAFISILVLISALILLIETILRREENQFYWLFLSCLFALTLAPTLITQINRIYLIPAIVWFVGVLPSYWLSKNAFSRHFIISFAALALFFQIPHWNDQLHEETKFLNQKRAEALRIAHEKEQWQSITMAEAHPLFSVAFGEEVAFSNEYDIGWDANGHLRNGHGKGDLIDYILLERPKKSHAYYDEIDHLKTLVKDFGEQVSGLDGYSVWKMNPVPLRVYEDETYAAELTDLRDDDIEEERCIALRWELDEPRCKEFHIWVEIDGSEPQYLGITRDPEDRDFYWNDQKKRLELVMKPFMRGPQFGHSYEFTVYGIPSDEAKAAKPKRLRSRGAIQFEESAAP